MTLRDLLSGHRSRVLANPLVNAVYRFLWYTEQGRAQSSRIYGWVPEFSMILVAAKVLFGVEPSVPIIIGLGVVAVSSFFLIGFLIKNLGFFDVDVYTQARKNPITMETLEAVRLIKKRFGKGGGRS